MSCLESTFTLTPGSPGYYDAALNNSAALTCYGADFWPGTPENFVSLYASDRFFFSAATASATDPNLDYTIWGNRMKVRFLYFWINLQSYAATNKQLALIFGFDVAFRAFPGRVLVYSDAGLLRDQQLAYGDNQFLIEIESLDLPFALYFIHAGGSWFFRGLSGYVV